MISVVIITKNEAANIAECIVSAKLITRDIIVVDCGSTDETIALSQHLGARVLSVPWVSYGYSRNAGAEIAYYDWILALDADERIDDQLAKSIRKCNFNIDTVYAFTRENYLGSEKICFGTFGFEKKNRIYNRYVSEWDLTLIHEQLITPCVTKTIKGKILHFSLGNYYEYERKVVRYAITGARKLFAEEKRITFIKKYTSSVFNWTKSYLFQLGFLDGYNGWIMAKGIAQQSFLKYRYLEKLYGKDERPKPMDEMELLEPAMI